jgi:rhamnulose-1-phosphate aldolase
MLGKAGHYLSSMGMCEGAAGNISVCLCWQLQINQRFPLVTEIELSQPVPELAGGTFIVTGSGTRLRELLDNPAANLACLVVNNDGLTAKMHKSHDCQFDRISSEFNSHLAVHYNQICSSNSNFHALIHVQPVHLTYLSHIPSYQDYKYINTHLLRWQPESILNLSEGIGLMPFEVPGSAKLMAGNVTAMQKYSVVIWAKHGVMARSDVSIDRAVDLVEYAETAAHYEYLNLISTEMAEGLTSAEIRAICAAYHIEQKIF